MLKSFLLAASLSLLTINAKAWWDVSANIKVTNTLVEAVVYNDWAEAIYCEGYVYARSASGVQAEIWMGEVIYPGQFGFAYLYAINPYVDPLVGGWADIRCNWY